MTPPQQATVSFDIAVLPGDGIGVDVTREAVRVLEALSFDQVKFVFHAFSVGAGEYLRSGDPLPAGTRRSTRTRTPSRVPPLSRG